MSRFSFATATGHVFTLPNVHEYTPPDFETNRVQQQTPGPDGVVWFSGSTSYRPATCSATVVVEGVDMHDTQERVRNLRRNLRRMVEWRDHHEWYAGELKRFTWRPVDKSGRWVDASFLLMLRDPRPGEIHPGGFTTEAFTVAPLGATIRTNPARE